LMIELILKNYDSPYRTASGMQRRRNSQCGGRLLGDYNVHHSDTSDHNLRWDIHPHKFPIPPDDRHFHSPPDALNVDEDVEPSCIDANRVPEVFTRREVYLQIRILNSLEFLLIVRCARFNR
jgi:hypothetical protein